MVCGFTGQNPVDKDFKVPNLAGVRASINRRCLALRAQPALGSCSCLAVLYQSVAAHVTRRPVPISHRNWLYRISSSFLTTGLGLSGVNFDDQAVGTNSKTRSRHRPRLSWESASIYPHEMSLKPDFLYPGRCLFLASVWGVTTAQVKLVITYPQTIGLVREVSSVLPMKPGLRPPRSCAKPFLSCMCRHRLQVQQKTNRKESG